jgi:hypothetical protein
VYEITAEGVAEFESWSSTPPADSLAAETDLLALKLAVVSSRTGAGVEWLAGCLADLDSAIAGWRRRSSCSRRTRPGSRC